jgi:predicted phosphodiesterase
MVYVSVPWSKHEDDLLCILKSVGKNNQEISNEMGLRGYKRSKDSIKNRLLRVYKPLRSITATEIIEVVKDSVQNLSTNPIQKQIDRANKAKKTQSLCIVLSDLHIGKKTVFNGEEVYNLRIAKERFRTLTENFLDVYESYIKKDAIIDEIIIALAGDIVDGELIYETQHAHVDTNVVKQMLKATRDLFEFIQRIADMDTKVPIRVVCCRGNHGRTSKVVSEESNWDLALYYQLRFAFTEIQKSKNIMFEVSDDDYIIFRIKGHKVMMRHMMPKDTSSPTARAKFGGWYAKHKWDIAVGGHWHTCKSDEWNDKTIFYNGCLSGTDDLAERMSLDSTPKQWVFGVSHKRVPTFIYKLDCEK